MASALYMLRSLRNTLDRERLKMLYGTWIEPHLSYGLTLWGGTFEAYLKKTVVLQKKYIRNIAKLSYNAHTEPMFKQMGLLNLSNLYAFEVTKFIFDVFECTLPTPLLKHYTLAKSVHTHNIRKCKNLRKPKFKLSISLHYILWKGPELWNSLLECVKSASTRNSFKNKLKHYLLSLYDSK